MKGYKAFNKGLNSSPLGDGLVLKYSVLKMFSSSDFRPRLGMGWFKLPQYIVTIPFYFRPRVGMGWFNAVMAVWGDNPTFSSPSVDGLVQEHGTSYSYGEYFRPHLGMGWFDFYNVTFVKDSGFSSPLGDGLVRVRSYQTLRK